jgi:hypothetical protein
MEVSIDRIGGLENPVIASAASRQQTPQVVGPSGETIPFG